MEIEEIVTEKSGNILSGQDRGRWWVWFRTRWRR